MTQETGVLTVEKEPWTGWKLEGKAESPACSRTVLWSPCRWWKAAACDTHWPDSSCQAPAPKPWLQAAASLQLRQGRYRVFKHLLMYWTGVASRPFLSTAKFDCFYFLNTHFITKVGANGYASTTSSHGTPTLLSHTGNFQPATPNCPTKKFSPDKF